MPELSAAYWTVRSAWVLWWYLLMVGSLTACGADLGAGSSVDGVSIAVGFGLSTEVQGLEGPTQIAWVGAGQTPDAGLLVAELAGGESDGTGRVSMLTLQNSDARIPLFSNLDKPTGVGFFDDSVWVMEATELSRGPIAGGELEPVASDLPNNGRSQGTLTVVPDERLLFNTSGSKRGADVVDGSGRLFSLAAGSGEISEVAEGFKHAYAHTVDSSGQLWAVEMTDGRFDGDPAPDEVVGVVENADHGWPHCVGDNRPVAEFGGNAERCESVPRSLAVFDAGATPTSVVVAPWDDSTLLVALWNRGQVVQISTAASAEQRPLVVASGLQNPQHLLAHGDDAVLLTEFGTGRILRLERA